ncbi:unnamed protein product [Prorocentrum cordatum]|uniref:EF-hand domain-containing protein n=1 Tax=Prorocentrum cordatum TaxID=2364126 RepID=A0ABN9S9N5_9DINO|nr:unnamed protein product [Polarella glacialis]
MGITINDVGDLFGALDADGTRGLSSKELVEGILRLRGPASAVDIASLKETALAKLSAEVDARRVRSKSSWSPRAWRSPRRGATGRRVFCSGGSSGSRPSAGAAPAEGAAARPCGAGRGEDD